MLNNLFSSFDTKNFIFFSFLLFNFFFFLVFSMSKKMSFLVFFFKKKLIFFYFYISSNFFFISIFIMIFLLNFLSLNFFSFNLTSQMSFNLVLIIMLCFPIFFLCLTKLNNSFLIHLLPFSTSSSLIPMMILIELMSFLIRPLTLFLRLSINMIAGHVLVSLISSMILLSSSIYLFLMYLYMLMKFLVSFIQAYIIITLLGLYIEEIYVN